jgi:SAM-dependent methyltransferase
MLKSQGFAARQVAINQEVWRHGDFVRDYSSRVLLPVEVLMIARYREVLSGRTLELGCGAGRVLGYLTQLGDQAEGIDVSARMVEYCRRAYPRARVRVADINQPETCGDGRYDAIWATDNVIDILDDANRRRVLTEFAEMIGTNGILIFSSHNLDARAARERARRAASRPEMSAALVRHWLARAAAKPPSASLRRLTALPARRRNRRSLAPLTYQGDGYAVLNDEAHDYQLLHYYIGRDAQERQLAEIGYGLIECFDIAGDAVAAGAESASSELHYVAYPK